MWRIVLGLLGSILLFVLAVVGALFVASSIGMVTAGEWGHLVGWIGIVVAIILFVRISGLDVVRISGQYVGSRTGVTETTTEVKQEKATDDDELHNGDPDDEWDYYP